MNNILNDSVSSVRSVVKDREKIDDRLDDLLPLHELAQEFSKDSPNVFIKAAINIASPTFSTGGVGQ